MTRDVSREWKRAADWRDDSATLEVYLSRLEWEHTTDRTPYDNLAALVEALPPEVTDKTIRLIAFRKITGLGPESAQRALEGIRNRGDSA